jgi:transposase
VSGQPQPSCEDIDALARLRGERIGELEQRLAELEKRVGQLAAENEELRRRLGSDSSNSSRPPSSDDPYGKPRPKRSGMRGRSGRRPGKQPGGPGVTRRQVADPDEVIGVEPGRCAGCGGGLADAPVVGVQKRQVFEASPPPPPRVVEYRVVARRCPGCGRLCYGQAPAWVSAPVQWGPGVQARAVLVTLAHHLPYGRAALVLRQLAGLAVSGGFLVAARRRAAALLEPFIARVRLLLAQAGLLHVDETPARVDGELAYLHVACNSAYTVMHTGGRSSADIDAGGVLPGFAGVIVRDGYAGYAHLVAAQHAWCGAHLLRDLKAVYDADPHAQLGAAAMAGTLTEALHATSSARAAGHPELDPDQLATLHSAYAGALARMRDDNQPARTPLHQRGLTLADRFDTHRGMILRFLHDLAVPFTNNAAEREIRPVKVKQRAGGGSWRTLQGLADFAVIWSYLSTAAKHGIDALDALTQLFTTGPWLPPDPAPTQGCDRSQMVRRRGRWDRR